MIESTVTDSDEVQAGNEAAYPRPQVGYRTLRREMGLALLSEIGARSVCHHLQARVKDDQLAELLQRINEEGVRNVSEVQQLIRELGGKPRRTSFRRRALARALTWMAPIVGARPVLRIVHNGADTLSRWYRLYANYLVQAGDTEHARMCERLSRRKRHHAQALDAWIRHMPRR